MLTPSTLTMPQQSTATVTIDTTVLSGVIQPLTFSLENLPKGVKFYFAPPVAVVGQEVVLTLFTDTVPVGTNFITIVAKSPVITHRAVLTLITTASDFGI